MNALIEKKKAQTKTIAIAKKKEVCFSEKRKENKRKRGKNVTFVRQCMHYSGYIYACLQGIVSSKDSSHETCKTVQWYAKRVYGDMDMENSS